MFDSLVIHFTKYQLDMIHILANIICESDENVVEIFRKRLGDNRTKEEILQAIKYGLLGEMGYCVATGKPYTLEVGAHFKNGRMDFEGVEIKSASWPGNDIYLKITMKEYDDNCPEFYVLIRFFKNDFSKIEILGSISRIKFDSVKKPKNFGYSTDDWTATLWDLEPFIPFKINGVLKVKTFKEIREEIAASKEPKPFKIIVK